MNNVNDELANLAQEAAGNDYKLTRPPTENRTVESTNNPMKKQAQNAKNAPPPKNIDAKASIIDS